MEDTTSTAETTHLSNFSIMDEPMKTIQVDSRDMISFPFDREMALYNGW